MIQNTYALNEAHACSTSVDTMSDETRDLTILNYMLQRVQEILPVFEKYPFLTAPLVSYVVEEEKRAHRIALYAHPPQNEQDLAFVGFMSGKAASTDTEVSQHLTIIDRSLVMELAQHPGLLSYSSFQQPNDDWANLVIFTQSEAKEGILATQMHRQAAYELAPQYYSWIRLHHGIIPLGDFQNGLQLRSTRYYSFSPGMTKPAVRVQVYESLSLNPTTGRE